MQQTLTNPLTRERILSDLEELFQQALTQDNLAIAMKIKEIQAKTLAVFAKETISLSDLEDLSDDEVEKIFTKLFR